MTKLLITKFPVSSLSSSVVYPLLAPFVFHSKKIVTPIFAFLNAVYPHLHLRSPPKQLSFFSLVSCTLIPPYLAHPNLTRHSPPGCFRKTNPPHLLSILAPLSFLPYTALLSLFPPRPHQRPFQYSVYSLTHPAHINEQLALPLSTISVRMSFEPSFSYLS